MVGDLMHILLERKDKRVWREDNDGKFSIKSHIKKWNLSLTQPYKIGL